MKMPHFILLPPCLEITPKAPTHLDSTCPGFYSQHLEVCPLLPSSFSLPSLAGFSQQHPLAQLCTSPKVRHRYSKVPLTTSCVAWSQKPDWRKSGVKKDTQREKLGSGRGCACWGRGHQLYSPETQYIYSVQHDGEELAHLSGRSL